MQGPGKGKRTFNEQSNPNGRSRVVDLRTWRNRKRIDGFKQRFNNRRSGTRTGVIVIAGIACVLAVLACIPSALQAHLVLLCWLVSLIGAGCALFMRVSYDRTVRRVLFTCLLCMALSFIVALFKVMA